MRRLTALTPFVTVVALASGCSSAASAQEIVSNAPKATIDASTAKVALEFEVTGAGSSSVSAAGEGAIDFGRQASAVTLDLGDMLAGLGGSGDDAVLEIRSIGPTAYLRSPLLAPGGRIPPGRWLKLDGADLSHLQQVSRSDPRQGLAFLEGVAHDRVERVGEDEVRGVDTTHYEAEVDVEEAVAEAGEVTDPEAFQRFVDSLDTTTLQLDVWIDGQNRVRRLEVPLSVPYSRGGAHATLTTEYWDFGADVDVRAPHDGDVIDLLGS